MSTAADTNGVGTLAELHWVQEMLASPSCNSVLTAGAMLSKDTVLPGDHFFTALLEVSIVRDMMCVFDTERRQFSSILKLGENVAGHPKIVHGGLTASLIDETLGGLTYILKRDGHIPAGPSFTVHLEVDYKRPVPSASTVICTADLELVDGRKSWVRAVVQDRPGGLTYASGKALFVIPKGEPKADALGTAFSTISPRLTESHTERLSNP